MQQEPKLLDRFGRVQAPNCKIVVKDRRKSEGTSLHPVARGRTEDEVETLIRVPLNGHTSRTYLLI